MENLALYKMRFSVLWLLWLVTDLCTGMLLLMEPDMIDNIRAGELFGMEIGPEMLLIGAVIYVFPLMMVVLSFVLKGSINRWLNIIVGAVYAFLGFTEIAEQVADPWAYRILMTLLKIVFSALIVWLAWKWPKQEE
jgi:uncharacterized membrane protein HdeD (DUF308 family)